MTQVPGARLGLMSDPNLLLYAATYDDTEAAAADYDALKAAQDDDFRVLGAVVMHRDEDGKVTVDERGPGAPTGGAILGGAAGLVVGLFAPPLLLSVAVGAGIGAVAGELVKKHQEKQIGLDMEDTLPPGSSAIVAIVNDVYADRVDRALEKASKKVAKAIDQDDYEKLSKALEEGGDKVTEALES